MLKAAGSFAAGRAAERADVLLYVADQARAVDGLVASKRVGAEEATLLKERLRAFADGIGAGLHLPTVPAEEDGVPADIAEEVEEQRLRRFGPSIGGGHG